MIKRINSLGRKRIARDCVAIAVHDGKPRRFSATIELPENGWPQDAIVVMEAMCAGSPIVRRFGCGTIGSLSLPLDVALDGITGQNVFFALKVIDHSEKIGRLLGVAENIRPIETGKQTEAGRRGILPVESVALGQQLWQLDFRDYDVYLLVNDAVDGLSERMRSDPMIYSLVYPEVIRQILARAIEQNIDLEEADDRWPYLWLSFGKTYIQVAKIHPRPTTKNLSKIGLNRLFQVSVKCTPFATSIQWLQHNQIRQVINMEMRRFNSKGIETFREALAICRDDPRADVSTELLSNNELSEVLAPAIDVELRNFATKRHAAVYFHEVLAPIPNQNLLDDAGLWTWLSLFYFDNICPKMNGQRKIRNDYTYVYEAGNMRYFYRHRFFVSWRILDIAPSHNRLLLDSRMSSLDKVTDQVMKRLYLTRIPCFFEVLDKIYWDETAKRSRKGVVDTSRVTAGDLTHRLPTRIRQLEKTYDLQSLTADQLIDLLGKEFQFGAGVAKQMQLSLPQL